MSRASTFSLSSRSPLPDSYNGHSIRTDHRTILRIMRMMRDPEIDDRDRMPLMLKMFYVGSMPKDAADGFEWFFRCGDTDESAPGSGKRDFDYEQDAQEIYAAFYQVYRIDLFEENLHWWRFSALLSGLFSTENALSNKVRLRHADDNDGQKKAALDRAKRAVAIKDAHSVSETTAQEQLQKALKEGADITAILNAMR